MESLLERISSYNIFNNLFPGALFVYLLEKSTSVILSVDDIVKNVVLYYFVGLVIGRIGSILLEPLLRFIRVVRFVPYSDYLAACRKDSKIEILQESANMYRTLLSMSLLYLLSLYVMGFLTGHEYVFSKYAALFFVIMFIISYIKQIRYIVSRVDKVNDKLP